MTASVLALDLPDAVVVERDLLDLHDALGERHIADIVDGDRGRSSRDGEAKAHGEEGWDETHRRHLLGGISIKPDAWVYKARPPGVRS